MRKSFVLKAVASLALTSVMSTAALAASTPTTVAGGTVHFTGELVNAACAVSTGSGDQKVSLGQARTAGLLTAGATANPTQFNIVLANCDPTVSATAGVAFNGPANTDGNSLLVSSLSTPGVAATNVGIQILDATGTVIQPNSGTAGKAATLVNNTNTLPFTARFISLGNPTPGAADADATFNVQYN